MRRTLLLCFVHGFKGAADSTFGGAHQKFAQDLRQRLAHALPRVDVRIVIYPTYETRGDLAQVVSHFVEWLLEQVIDLEVAARTPSPTVDPSVHCLLIGHSMGGIVAADALLSLVGDVPISHDPHDSSASNPALNAMMFPYIQGVLGFDTPYLGIAPGVVAHGAEEKYAAATAAMTQISTLAESFWGKKTTTTAPKETRKALPAPESTSTNNSSWGVGKIALASALASGAAAAAAAAAYKNRDQLSAGWTWAASHLQFVGCLARGEELKRRVAHVVEAHDQLGVGFGNLYTRLGRASKQKTATATMATLAAATTTAAAPRTFCVLPDDDDLVHDRCGQWREAVNDGATDETWAHMSMFDAAENPNYAQLLADARDLIVAWTRDTAWYVNSGTSNNTSGSTNNGTKQAAA